MNIEIPSPCPESWDAMLPDEKGKHCLTCDKVVVDFAQMNSEKIVAYFQIPRDKKVCGRFLSSQLGPPQKMNDPLSTLQSRLFGLNPSFRFLSMSLCVLTSLLTLVGCKEEIKAGEVEIEPSEIQLPVPKKVEDSVETKHVKVGKVESGKMQKVLSRK